MSALARFSQSMVSSSYCESRLVSGEAAACAILGRFRFVCRMIVMPMVQSQGSVAFLRESCQFALPKLNLCAWRRGRVNEEGARRRTSGYHSPTVMTTFTGIAN